MNPSTSKSSVPSSVTRKLRLVRQRKISVLLLSAFVAALAVLMTAMALAMLIDWLATLYDSRWRAVLTAAALATALATVVGWVLLAWRRGLRWERVAHDVDRQLPQMEERWTTMARLGPHATNPNVVHPAMLRRVASEAAQWEPHVDPQQVVSMSILGRAMLGLTAIAATLCIAVVLDSHRTLVLLQRFWQPGSSISATELVGTPGDLVVGKGEPIELTAAIKGSPVNQAVLFMRSGSDEPQKVTLVANGQQPITFMHRLRAVDSPFSYLFRAGDGQTSWHNVEVAERPEIAELRMSVTPPEYTGRPAAKFDNLPRRLSAQEQSTLELTIRPTVPLKSLQLRLDNENVVELTADTEGWYRWTTTLQQSFSLSPMLTETHGLTNRRVMKSQINVFPDKPPVVTITTPDDQVAVRPDDTLNIHFTARDDIGIGNAELVVYADSDTEIGQVPLLIIPIPLDEQRGATKVEGIVDLDLSKLQVIDGSRLSYEVRVSESRDGQVNAAAAQRTEERPRPVRATNATPADTLASNQGDPTNPSPSADAQNESSASPAAMSEPNADATANSSATSATTGAEAGPSSESTAASDSAAPSDTTATNDAAAPSDSVATSETTTASPDSPRDATSERQTVSSSTSSEQAADPNAIANAANDPATDAPATGENNASAENANANNGGQAQNSMAAASAPSSPSSPSSAPPPNDMTRRSLDVPAQSSSSRMRIAVDEWAGSYDGQQRKKLEIAIAPELAALDAALASAQQSARGVLDDMEAPGEWRGRHDRDMTNAERSTVDAQQVIRSLMQRTRETPYAFIGLQLADIGMAHVGPARQSFWTSLQTEGDARVDSVRDGWQHVTRARQMIAELEGQFQRAQQEFELAEKLQQVKKMYQIFIENSLSLLNGDANDPTRYAREMVEFNLDEEYLKRLREVLEMRRDMQAELARILAEDPRLLRRFMDSFRNRTTNLREELANLVADQNDLNREVRAWTLVEDSDRPRIAQILLQRHLLDANRLAVAAGDSQERYQTWLPLDRKADDADLKPATDLIQATATAANELAAGAASFDAELRRAKLPQPADAAATSDADAEPAWSADKALAKVRSNADTFNTMLRDLDIVLRQLGARQDDAEIAVFAANRLVEARRLIAQSTAWTRQLDEQMAGNYPRAAEVEQYRLAEVTERLAGRLGDIEQTLSGLLQRRDGQLPEAIAEKARVFIAALDKQASPNQLASVYALRGNQMPRVTQLQQAAYEGLVAAETAFDEMMRLAMIELDKLPVQDPIAGLLNDPTLDELLAALEQERALAELLGIPPRPSNLQIVGDWMRPGSGPGQGMARNQLRQRGERARNRLDRSYREAIARALNEENNRQPVVASMPGANVNWNTLVAELDDELQQGRDKAPPEQYRQAISQYFNEISRAAAEKQDNQP